MKTATQQTACGPKFIEPRRYATLEAAMYGVDGASFANWAVEVLAAVESPVEAGKIILKAIMPTTYPFISADRADQLVDSYFDSLNRDPARPITREQVAAFTFGLVFGIRIGKLTVAGAALGDAPSTLAIDPSGCKEVPEVPKLPSLSALVFSRPAGSDASINAAAYTVTQTEMIPVPPGMTPDSMAETIDKVTADITGRGGDDRIKSVMGELFRRAADRNRARKAAPPKARTVEEILQAEGYSQGTDGQWAKVTGDTTGPAGRETVNSNSDE